MASSGSRSSRTRLYSPLLAWVGLALFNIAAIAGTTGVFASVLYMLYWTVNGLAIYAVIKVPQRFPRLVSALGMRSSLAWSVFGLVATSSFYAVLHGVRSSCRDWSEVAGFFARLLH